MWTICLALILSTTMLNGDNAIVLDLEHPGEDLLIKTGNIDLNTHPPEWTITKTEQQGDSVQLLELINPKITTAVYALQGEVSYQVEGKGYLELNHFYGDSGTFFTRSLSPDGPMGVLKGKVSWRKFILPFYRNSKGNLTDIELPAPQKLTLNLHLDGSGTVQFRNIKLVNLKQHPDLSIAKGQWWSKRQSGLYFGGLGTLIGVMYALMGFLASRGKNHREVCHLLLGLGIFGFLLLLGAFSGALLGQPDHVTWPFFFSGSMMVGFLLFFRPRLWERYRKAELLKMESKDI